MPKIINLLSHIRGLYKFNLKLASDSVIKLPTQEVPGMFQAAFASRFRRVTGAYAKNMTYKADPGSLTKISDRNLDKYLSPDGVNIASRVLGPTYSDLIIKGKSIRSIFEGSFNSGGSGIVSDDINKEGTKIAEEYLSKPIGDFSSFLNKTLKYNTIDKTLGLIDQYTSRSLKINKIELSLSLTDTLKQIHDALEKDTVLFNGLTQELLKGLGSTTKLDLLKKPNFDELKNTFDKALEDISKKIPEHEGLLDPIKKQFDLETMSAVEGALENMDLSKSTEELTDSIKEKMNFIDGYKELLSEVVLEDPSIKDLISGLPTSFQTKILEIHFIEPNKVNIDKYIEAQVKSIVLDRKAHNINQRADEIQKDIFAKDSAYTKTSEEKEQKKQQLQQIEDELKKKPSDSDLQQQKATLDQEIKAVEEKLKEIEKDKAAAEEENDRNKQEEEANTTDKENNEREAEEASREVFRE